MLVQRHSGQSWLHLILGFAPAVIFLGMLSGCEGESSTKPAPVEQEQMKKAQQYLGNYREQMVAANKAKAKSKGKASEAEKTSEVEKKDPE
jgi:hypothetical protein